LLLPSAEELERLVTACSASLTSLTLPGYERLDVEPHPSVPPVLSQLTALRQLQLGCNWRSSSSWRFDSVAALRGLAGESAAAVFWVLTAVAGGRLGPGSAAATPAHRLLPPPPAWRAGLRQLTINTIPADLACLTHLTLLEVALAHKADRPLAAAPIAALTRLRHLDLCHCGGSVGEEVQQQERQQLLLLSTLTSLQLLHLDLEWRLEQLPPLPELRTLRTAAVLDDAQLRQMPHLTELLVHAWRDVEAAAALPPPCPRLQSVCVMDRTCLASFAPGVRHVSCPFNPRDTDVSDCYSSDYRDCFAYDRVHFQSDQWRLADMRDLPQLRSLQVDVGVPGLGCPEVLWAAAAGQLTRLVLTDFRFDEKLLHLCGVVSALELHLDPEYGGNGPEVMDVKCWLLGMGSCAVRDLTVCFSQQDDKVSDWEHWLPLLADWRKLRRVALHWRLPPMTRQAAADLLASPHDYSDPIVGLAGACQAQGSPLEQLELHFGKEARACGDDVFMEYVHGTLVAVERASPRITCTVHWPED
jgi:hypothetical protein